MLATSFSTELRLKELECDIWTGKWERDPEAPYYTNDTCSTIQDHQNCMKNGRPDTEFLKWRWKPDGCELPRFDPKVFFKLVQGKTVAFIGDSLARNQMQSLMCLLSRVEYPEDISETTDENFKRMYYSAYNFTISIFWSPFLVKTKQPAYEAPSLDHMWKLYLDETDENWTSKIDNFDYLIISGGTWFTRPLLFYEKRQVIGCQYCDIKNFPKIHVSYFHRMAFRTALQGINKSPSYRGTTIVRTISPPHFENGAWDHGGDCQRTRPARRGEKKMEKIYAEMYRNQIEEFEVGRKEGRKRGLEFMLMDMTGAMLQRPDGHPSGYWSSNGKKGKEKHNDCVHWCLPGPVDLWNDLLFHMLRRQGNWERD
ncbi:PC-Esterase protein [Dioscorea alata]|uniref:PC-Esterase protein n=1 Tax=Dioscorea alata TaxID=55571 RepID=A0ACB7U6Z0_DIOAL|nr:PC-Esterase protein [Dioscorea alata]